MIARWAIWLFAFCNVLLYASVLPLWEGFDEPFHYGYVQYLWTQHQLPITGRASLSEEVWDSLHANPGSYLVRKNLPFVETFEDWFRRGGHGAIGIAGSKWKLIPEALNYEAQQAPLSYAVLAIPDMLLSHVGLPARIWWLRVIAGCISVALVLTAMMRFTPSPAAWFAALCVQMMYATVVHISNDWLAVGLSAWFIVACSERRAWLAATVLALGLLTKAYFLAFLPILFFATGKNIAPLSVLLVAVPLYVRNAMLYGNISGVFITEPKMDMVQAATSINWLGWLSYMLHAGLWTGNNSFTSFSKLTLDMLIALLVIGFLLALRKMARGTLVTLACLFAMLIVLAYSTVMLRAYTGGETTGTGPWYIPAILSPVIAVSFNGLGRMLRIAVVVLSAYIINATYWVKLIPMYAGFAAPRATLGALIAWYGSPVPAAAFLANKSLVYCCAGAMTALSLACALIIYRCRELPASRP